MGSATTTTDHDEIRKWVEARGGHPSMVKSKKQEEGGILRIDFGEPEDSLEEISWDEFFEVFDENKLAFLYQGEGESRFNKFVNRH